MHVRQPVTEIFVVTDESVPELVLPQRPVAVSARVEAVGGNPLDILHHARDGQRVIDADQGVPVIRHENVATKGKAQLLPGFLDCFEKQWKLLCGEFREVFAKVHRDEEGPVG